MAPPPILDYIGNGYCLPLKLVPPPHSQNHKSAAIEFVTEAMVKTDVQHKWLTGHTYVALSQLCLTDQASSA